jgi:hypothetical protein
MSAVTLRSQEHTPKPKRGRLSSSKPFATAFAHRPEAIEDESFGVGFAGDAELRGRWPVQGTMTHDDGTTEEVWV